MSRSHIQKDVHTGEHRRGTIPQSVHFQTDDDRIAELKSKRDSLPAESSSRAIIVETLRRDYDVF